MIRSGNILYKPGIDTREVDGVVDISRFGHLGSIVIFLLISEDGVTIAPQVVEHRMDQLLGLLLPPVGSIDGVGCCDMEELKN